LEGKISLVGKYEEMEESEIASKLSINKKSKL